jgi:hypothetical protein
MRTAETAELISRAGLKDIGRFLEHYELVLDRHPEFWTELAKEADQFVKGQR